MAVPLSQELDAEQTVTRIRPFAWPDWLSCVAVANFCLIRIWTDLLAYPVWPAHRDYDPPQLGHYAAAVLLTLLLGTLLWFSLNRAGRSWLHSIIGVIALLFAGKEAFLALSSLGTVPRASLLAPMPLAILALVLSSLGVTLYRNSVSVRKTATKLAASMIPLTLLTFGQSAWQATHIPPPAVRSIHSPAQVASKAKRRVVWLILDELDERVAFSQRRASVRLPELDRFRREAGLVALQAKSPDNATLASLPRLLEFSLSAGQASQSVVARARKSGHRTAVVGWALPYCAVLEKWVDSCRWWPMPQQHNSYGSGLAGTLRGYLISLFETNQLSPFGQSLAVQHFARTVEEMTVAAAEAASRPDLDFVFLHLPPPHNPYAFNARTGKIDRMILRFPNPEGYFENLLLADQVFGRIRRSMERTGVWENSLVLVTADHGVRSGAAMGYALEDRHVPFMVKSPTPLPVDPQAPLATERTGELLLNWLNAPQS